MDGHGDVRTSGRSQELAAVLRKRTAKPENVRQAPENGHKKTGLARQFLGLGIRTRRTRGDFPQEPRRSRGIRDLSHKTAVHSLKAEPVPGRRAYEPRIVAFPKQRRAKPV